jgi:ATP-dependent protease ClpP protease subunit
MVPFLLPLTQMECDRENFLTPKEAQSLGIIDCVLE